MPSPLQFQEFALPYSERLVAEFPGIPMLVGSGGDATHLIAPLMKSSVPVPFLDAASDLEKAVEQAKAHNKPITVLFPRQVLMGRNRNETQNGHSSLGVSQAEFSSRTRMICSMVSFTGVGMPCTLPRSTAFPANISISVLRPASMSCSIEVLPCGDSV